MNRDILKQIADAHYQLADLYTQLAADTAIATPDTFADGQPYEPETGKLSGWVNAEGGDQGSEAVCPKHKKPFVEGKYGLYCTSPSDDPAWSNRKGYCNLTPKNVAQYLRVKAAA